MRVNRTIDIHAGNVVLSGDLEVPESARALVVFAHGSGSSRRSPRNRMVASALRHSGRMGTLLFDLLTPGEDAIYANRFDIALLADRLAAAAASVRDAADFEGWPLGYFGASTGAAAAIVAAVEGTPPVTAIVSRGGRPDLADEALDALQVPTLLIVGGYDYEVFALNKQALARMPVADKRLSVVPGATHLFEEPGTLETAAGLALRWFEQHLLVAEATTSGS